MQLLERAIRGEDKDENEWLKVQPIAVTVTETDLEPQDYDLDISREVTLIMCFLSISSISQHTNLSLSSR